MEEAAKRKALMEAEKARRGVPTSRGMLVTVSSAMTTRTTQPASHNQPRGYNKIAEEARRRKEEVATMPRDEHDKTRGTTPPPKKTTKKPLGGNKRLQSGNDHFRVS